MRRALTTTAALALLLVPALQADAQEGGLRIGYINSQRILEQAPGAQEATDQLNQDLQGFQQQVQQMAQDLQEMIQQYERQQLTLSADAKERREQEILAARQEYQAKVEELDQKANERQAELVQPIMDKITQVIEEIRAEGNYTLIFDVAAGAIISADPSLDLTEEVIRRLQAQEGQTTSSGNGG